MAGDTFIRLVSGQLTEVQGTQTSAGAGNAGDIPALDGSGKLDSTLMPTGFGQDSLSLSTAETIASRDFVHINASGAVEKASNVDGTKPAVGFVQTGGAHPTTVSVFFEGTVTGFTGLTPGARQFLSTSGGRTETPPTGTGELVQLLGYATSATAITFGPYDGVVLA